MYIRSFQLVTAVLLVTTPFLVIADELRLGGETSIPIGWRDFCQRHKDQCLSKSAAPTRLTLTDANRGQIDKINKEVNKSIQAVSDPDHWKLSESWDYPTDHKGDCEDFALEKRRRLLKAGIPLSALSIAVVRKPVLGANGDVAHEGHAVLIIRTDKGDFVLDDLNLELIPWRNTQYEFVKMQAPDDPKIWLEILPPQDPKSKPSAGPRTVRLPPPSPWGARRAK